MDQRPPNQATPSTGLRIAIERDANGPPWRYHGVIVARDLEVPVTATLEESGAVTVQLTEGAVVASTVEQGRTEALLERVRLLLRTISRQAQADDADPPRKIVRWRDA